MSGSPHDAAADDTAVAARKAAAVAAVDELAPLLLDVSHRIWERPELCFEEHAAHDMLCDALDAHGMAATRHAYGLETAFEASAGAGGPEVAVMCEYDALPGIGHACGHNVIAAAGLGAGLALARLAGDGAAGAGRVRVLGTPAEEGGGGKELMLRRGALDGLAAAMMVHPADADLPTMTCVALQELAVSYHGRAAHAAAAPHLGANALDAAVLGYMGVAALRQHIRSDERVHGIFTRAGDKANIVPAETAAQWYVRAADLAALEALKPRVLAALEAGAVAAGCECDHEWHDPAYADMVDHGWLLEAFAANATAIGRPIDPSRPSTVVGSTDMGNVSHHVPSIHPMLAVAPPGVSIHTPDFAEHARGPAGDRAVLDGAKALACTAIDVWAAGGVPAA
jgi:amidohydrolase